MGPTPLTPRSGGGRGPPEVDAEEDPPEVEVEEHQLRSTDGQAGGMP